MAPLKWKSKSKQKYRPTSCSESQKESESPLVQIRISLAAAGFARCSISVVRGACLRSRKGMGAASRRPTVFCAQEHVLDLRRVCKRFKPYIAGICGESEAAGFWRGLQPQAFCEPSGQLAIQRGDFAGGAGERSGANQQRDRHVHIHQWNAL